MDRERERMEIKKDWMKERNIFDYFGVWVSEREREIFDYLGLWAHPNSHCMCTTACYRRALLSFTKKRWREYNRLIHSFQNYFDFNSMVYQENEFPSPLNIILQILLLKIFSLSI